MSDTPSSIFVRQDLVPERPAPVKTTGFIGFLRTRLFNSPTNILITIVCALLLWFIVVPALRFTLFDAVWTGKDRTACLPKNPGDVVGACWPFIQAKFSQFIYGFYPEPERWRVNLVFILAAILLIPLLIPRLPGKAPNAILFFLAFPVVAFFLLVGGGLGGFGVSWTAGLLSGFNDSIGDGGRKLAAAGQTTAVIGPLLWLLGKLIELISMDVAARAPPGVAVEPVPEDLEGARQRRADEHRLHPVLVDTEQIEELRQIGGVPFTAQIGLGNSDVAAAQEARGEAVIVDLHGGARARPVAAKPDNAAVSQGHVKRAVLQL